MTDKAGNETQVEPWMRDAATEVLRVAEVEDFPRPYAEIIAKHYQSRPQPEPMTALKALHEWEEAIKDRASASEGNAFIDGFNAGRSSSASAPPTPQPAGTTPYTIREIEGAWIAHALAFDLVGADSVKEKAVEKLKTCLAAQIAFGRKQGIDYRRCWFPAPAEYWIPPYEFMPLPSDEEMDAFKFKAASSEGVSPVAPAPPRRKWGTIWGLRGAAASGGSTSPKDTTLSTQIARHAAIENAPEIRLEAKYIAEAAASDSKGQTSENQEKG
jgi:hypothetical protein